MVTEKLGPLVAHITGGADGDGGGDGPVVVLLHGFGAPGTDLVSLGAVLPSPPGTRFVFLEAPHDLTDVGMDGARAWWMIDMERMQRAIASGEIRNMSAEVPDGLAEANAMVNAALDAMEKRLGVSADRVVLGGFSQGAMLATDVTLRSDRKFAGLAIMSGTLLAAHEWTPLMAARAHLPIFQSHGIYDPLLPFVLAERLRDLLVQAGATVDFVPFPGEHEIPRPALVGLVRLISTALA